MTQAQAANREPTMEEILASIRRIIEDNNAPKVVESEPETHEAVSITEADIASFEREFAAADVFSKPVQNSIAAMEGAKLDLYKPEAVAPAQTYIEPTIDLPRTFAPQSAAIELVEQKPSPFQELRPIISQEASRQVAKSFEHLSVALHEERGTSVAQMTEEMVRPMLQDWLDNNLPTLVERLVREEIERVSRGTR